MTLEDFETQIDPIILERGIEYFQDGTVDDLEENKKGQWSAIVCGSEEYEVSVTLKNLEIKKWECDCPYDQGPICKHVVAVLYSIKEERNSFTDAEIIETDSKADKIKTVPKATGAKKDTKPKGTIDTLLQNVSFEELKDFVKNQMHGNSEFKNAFYASFAEKQEGEAKPRYIKLIRSIVRTIIGKRGFIDYRSASKLTSQMMGLCAKSSQLLAKNNLTESLAITQAIIEEMPDIVMGMDDSDGGACEIWAEVFENFYNLIKKAPPLLKDELFDYCISQYKLQKYQKAGFEDYFIDTLLQLVQSRDQEQRFFKLLDDQIILEQQNKYGEYNVISLLRSKVQYLEANNRVEEAMVIVNNNIEFDAFRDILFDEAIKQKKYEDARQLCLVGMDIAKKKEHPGTVNKYQQKLLQIAELEKDVMQIRKLSEMLFFDIHYNFDYYRKLKKNWEKNKWPEKCEEIISKIKKSNARGSYGDATLLANVFVEEGYWDRLLLLLQINSIQLRFIDSFSNHLITLYPNEIIQLYEKAIISYAEGTGRGVYNDVARYLKKLGKIPGGIVVVNKLISQFREKYRMRKAMLEVLNKHFT
jgi:hypothetical protein